jgi:hypothetical protein
MCRNVSVIFQLLRMNFYASTHFGEFFQRIFIFTIPLIAVYMPKYFAQCVEIFSKSLKFLIHISTLPPYECVSSKNRPKSPLADS